MEYSVILGPYQFDFGHKDSRVLLEVQGDYWHGNPEIYDNHNPIQRSMRLRDEAKKEWAAQHGFLLFEIWEKEVNEKNFQTLKELQNAIQSNSGISGRN